MISRGGTDKGTGPGRCDTSKSCPRRSPSVGAFFCQPAGHKKGFERGTPLFPIATLHGSTAPAAAILHGQRVVFETASNIDAATSRSGETCSSLPRPFDPGARARRPEIGGHHPGADDGNVGDSVLRADRNAARVRLPLLARNRANRKAQNRWTTNTPAPVMGNANGSGGTGLVNLPHSAHGSARAAPAGCPPTPSRPALLLLRSRPGRRR